MSGTTDVMKTACHDMPKIMMNFPNAAAAPYCGFEVQDVRPPSINHAIIEPKNSPLDVRI